MHQYSYAGHCVERGILEWRIGKISDYPPPIFIDPILDRLDHADLPVQ